MRQIPSTLISKSVPVQRVILIVERSFKPGASWPREKLEPPASLKTPRALSFLLPMRGSAKEKSLSASGFALRATTRQVAEGGTADTWGRSARQYALIARRVGIFSESSVPIREKSFSLASLAPCRNELFL
jgi:hypothetical protein